MYDELIKDLREWPRVCIEYTGSLDELHDKAADAIEGLATNYDAATDIMKHQTEYIEELSKSRWIPVTERLPEERINQNTLDFEYVLCTTTFGDVRPYKYGRKIGQREAHFWNGAGYVDAYVTHWMPLPEPQKEG